MRSAQLTHRPTIRSPSAPTAMRHFSLIPVGPSPRRGPQKPPRGKGERRTFPTCHRSSTTRCRPPSSPPTCLIQLLWPAGRGPRTTPSFRPLHSAATHSLPASQATVPRPTVTRALRCALTVPALLSSPALSPAATATAGGSSCCHLPLCLFGGHPPLSRTAKMSGGPAEVIPQSSTRTVTCCSPACWAAAHGPSHRGPRALPCRHGTPALSRSVPCGSHSSRRLLLLSPLRQTAPAVVSHSPRLSPTGPNAGPPSTTGLSPLATTANWARLPL
ncbi:hypothetical protein NDU88_001912 [Pleurodeles waltl]|uniref:Uncharacterized protein n=1 Tax=Pleurodeles waltl TaxID=8319 RepID=A0AAV7W1U3_PLEWA|nr:hypothetical protein NDU88_001912 [Pleurodeles waltl]